ncbi:heme-binding protein [Mycolicibacterium chitae]|uniref:SOUL heme-binding protein n=2 Tax=Mycolicibacterium TaxID=1866885 RepID=A0A3S4T024_MYCCI|nr:heme-binding protein [Mycolicibacterium chitae]MCV7106934.1 heme-binding protein [Mycolicibacterium chitae]BBZ03937.1 heme-binding protein [Mycolicibacterium chitae]VEG47588.1 SOUL heme-binding protein [Mycolicibacterium chitae]
MITRIVSGIVQLAGGLGGIVGIRVGTEEPMYLSEPLSGGVEIRRYGPRIAAETTVLEDDEQARNTGFRRLAGYIFGGNSRQTSIAMTAPVAQSSEKIAMTAPVAQSRDPQGGSVIRFYMPAKWSLATLPSPNDSHVRLVEVPAETFAVLRFTGDRSPAAVQRRTEELLKTLADNGIKSDGEALSWFYDPPWTIPFRRRNEVAVPIAE